MNIYQLILVTKNDEESTQFSNEQVQVNVE